MMLRTTLAAALIAALAACQPSAPSTDTTATDTSAKPEVTQPAEPVRDSADPAPAPGNTADIPTAFHGTWDKDAASCSSASSDMRLVIDAKSLKFHESFGGVKSINTVSPTQVFVTADFEGEGEKWTNIQNLQLSDGGKKLTTTLDGDSSVSRVRCG